MTRLFSSNFSGLGFAFGCLFLAASLTPSMIPKSALLIGVLGGVTFAIGYFLAVVLIGLWRYMELPEFAPTVDRRPVLGAFTLLGLIALIWGLSLHRPGQNSIRSLMGIEPLGPSHEFLVLAISTAIFILSLLFARSLALLTRRLNRGVARFVPPRVSITLSIILVAAFSWYLSNGVILRWSINSMDRLLAEIDAHIDPDLPAPSSALRSGSPESSISWETMGARGRAFVAGGWNKDAISTFHGREDTDEPIRIYAGLNSGDTVKARVQLVLDEMIRTKAFERAVVVVATPTGTGWIDEAAIDPLEVLFGGDIAVVGIQYSYLMSPLALLVEPDVAPASAIALTKAVQAHWNDLPEANRPKLYLHGLSLGSYGSEQALSIVDWIDNPVSGALWSGPTYGNVLWTQFTRSRNLGSPVWLPKIGEGRTVRFTTQQNTLGHDGDEWPEPRIVYLQYPSDPITFFELSTALRPPDWLIQERAPDVSDLVRWYPVVTMLQLAIDMLAGTEVPVGFGHLFAAEHYIDAWYEISEPIGITETDVERLKSAFR